MNGYVAQRRGRFYAVIYEGRDPVTGKEMRRWHPAGTDRAEAERLATSLAAAERKRTDVGPFVDVRCLPDQPVAPGQEAAPRHEHLPGLRTQRRPPRPARPRADRDPSVALPADRITLRLAPAPHRRTGPVPQDRVRDPPPYPGRAHRRAPSRARDPQRRARRPGPQAAVAPEDRRPSLDRRRAPPVPAHRSRSPVLPDPVADRHDRHAPQRGPRAQVARHRLHEEAPPPQPGPGRRRLRGAPDPRQDPQRPTPHHTR